MQFNVNRIPEGHSVLSQRVQATGERSEWLSSIGTISCNADVDRLHAQVYLHVRYECAARLPCSRCLEPVDIPIAGEFRVVLQQKMRSDDRDGLPVDNVDLFFDDVNGIVDISPLIFDEILLSLPMKPLCSEECKGLAVESDSAIIVDYAEAEKPVDPRWKELSKLRNKEKL